MNLDNNNNINNNNNNKKEENINKEDELHIYLNKNETIYITVKKILIFKLNNYIINSY